MKTLMRYHGGKARVSKKIIEHFPPHRVYVEPFGGAAGVLLNKPPLKFEVYNDINEEIVNLFRILRDAERVEELKRLCELTPYSRAEFNAVFEVNDRGSDIERARKMLFRSWTGFSGAGAAGGKTGMSVSTAENGANVVRRWRNFPKRLILFIERLREVIIENDDSLSVMKRYDGPDTLFYVDPPYTLGQRISKNTYAFEMSDDDHVRLCETLLELEGKVILSGCDNPIYNKMLSRWRKVPLDMMHSAHSGSVSRREWLWVSFKTPGEQMSRFKTDLVKLRHQSASGYAPQVIVMDPYHWTVIMLSLRCAHLIT